MHSFESIQNLIRDFSKTNLLGTKLSEAQLQQEWKNLVGETMAKHSYPESIRSKKLYLVADNSIWLQQLVFLKPAILEAVHSLMPDLALTDVVLRIGSLPPAPPPPDQDSPDQEPPAPDSSPFAANLARRVSDPDLQTLLSRTISKAMAAPPSLSTPPAKGPGTEEPPPPISP